MATTPEAHMSLSNNYKLHAVKTTHTAIYLTMVAAIFYTLFAAITQSYTPWLYTALALLMIESAVFLGNGMKCPLTALARQYGDPKGYVGDTFLPEKYTRYTFRVFGALFAIALLILIFNR
jgi:hypothetical protein